MEEEMQYPEEINQDDIPQDETKVPNDFVYKPVEVPHKIDWLVILLAALIISAFGYVLFATTSVFEQ